MAEARSSHAHRLDLPAAMRIHEVFNVSLMRPVVTNLLSRQHAPPLLHVVVDNEEEYLVKYILDSRMRCRRLKLLVKLSGYETPNCEHISCVNDTVALDRFISLHPNKPRPAE